MNKEEFVEMIFQEIHKQESNLSIYKGINHSQYFKKTEKKAGKSPCYSEESRRFGICKISIMR